MRINIATRKGIYSGGAPRSIYLTVRELCREHEVHFFSCQKGELVDDIRNLGVKTTVYPSDVSKLTPTRENFIDFLTSIGRIMRLSRKFCEGADLVIANGVENLFFALHCKRRVCLVRGFCSYYYKMLVRWMRPYMVYNSEIVRNSFSIPGPVMFPPIDMDLFRIREVERNRHTVLYPGRLAKEKCVEHAISCVEGTDIDLLIAGNMNWQREYTEWLMDISPPNVHFLGNRDDIPELMCTVGLVVLPSLKEPFGRVIPEALATGTPVLCSHDAGCLDYMDLPGEMVYRHGDIREMKDKMFRTLHQEWDPWELRELATPFSTEAYGERIREFVNAMGDGIAIDEFR